MKNDYQPIMKIVLLLNLILCLNLFNCVYGETKMYQDKTIADTWKLSNTDSAKQAGIVKAQNAALIVIDFQNFNANKNGFLGYLFDDKNHAIQRTKNAIEKARKAHVPIIYLNTVLKPKLMPETALFNNLKKLIPWNKLTKTDLEWNFAVIEELKPMQDDYIAQKGSWSNGFRDTDLRSIIHSLKVRTLIFTGVAEPIAIYGTFLGAWDEGLESVMLEDCIMASGTDQKIQDTIHNYSKNTFYPMMGAKVTNSKFLNFE